MPYRDWAIIGRPQRSQLLLLPGETGWALPFAEHAERHFWQSVAPVNQAIGPLLAIDVTTLRCVHTDYEHNWYALECHDPNWQAPDRAVWVGRSDLGTLELALPEQRPLLEAWFDWDSTTIVPEHRPPWYMPGWFGRASAWIVEQLDRLGMPTIAPIEQLRSWERSAILRASTASGLVYFKAVPAMFAHELALALAAPALAPAHFAPLLAYEPRERWMLMPDLGGPTLDQLPDLGRWQSALRDFARLQIGLASATAELELLGCPKRPLDLLASQIDGLLADTPALSLGGNGLSPDQISDLRGRAPELKAMCAKLAALPIPLTLEHGDFWAGQVVAQGAANMFIDWSDSSIAHPFFSMNFFADTAESEQFLPGVANLHTQLRDAYLEPWAGFATAETLVYAFELAQKLSALHNAVTYHQWVLPHMEARWEMHNMIPFYLRKLL